MITVILPSHRHRRPTFQSKRSTPIRSIEVSSAELALQQRTHPAQPMVTSFEVDIVDMVVELLALLWLAEVHLAETFVAWIVGPHVAEASSSFREMDTVCIKVRRNIRPSQIERPPIP